MRKWHTLKSNGSNNKKGRHIIVYKKSFYSKLNSFTTVYIFLRYRSSFFFLFYFKNIAQLYSKRRRRISVNLFTYLKAIAYLNDVRLNFFTFTLK